MKRLLLGIVAALWYVAATSAPLEDIARDAAHQTEITSERELNDKILVISPTPSRCFPGVPVGSSVAFYIDWGNDHAFASLQRAACASDANVTFLRLDVTPQFSRPFVCSSSFVLIVGSKQWSPMLIVP